jgi:hypothetical protein
LTQVKERSNLLKSGAPFAGFELDLEQDVGRKVWGGNKSDEVRDF